MATEAPRTHILDEEVLYRSVADERLFFDCDASGRLSRLSANAFNDRSFEPSVDRACMRAHASESRKGDACGVVSIGALEVRGIKVCSMTSKGTVDTSHDVDVLHSPEPDNYSHALVKTAPTVSKDGVFRRLKEALARLAQARDWAFRPESIR